MIDEYMLSKAIDEGDMVRCPDCKGFVDYAVREGVRIRHIDIECRCGYRQHVEVKKDDRDIRKPNARRLDSF